MKTPAPRSTFRTKKTVRAMSGFAAGPAGHRGRGRWGGPPPAVGMKGRGAHPNPPPGGNDRRDGQKEGPDGPGGEGGQGVRRPLPAAVGSVVPAEPRDEGVAGLVQ